MIGNQRQLLLMLPAKKHFGNPLNNVYLSPHPQDFLEDSLVPITLRKGVCSCIAHQLSNFMSDCALSLICSFVFAWSFVCVPHNVSGTLSLSLSQLVWKAFMEEETRASFSIFPVHHFIKEFCVSITFFRPFAFFYLPLHPTTQPLDIPRNYPNLH